MKIYVKYDTTIQGVTNFIVAFEIKFSEAIGLRVLQGGKFMGLILVGILSGAVLVGLIFVYCIKSNKPNRPITSLLLMLTSLCVITGFFSGITKPVSGYEEPQIVSTTELVSLRDNAVSVGDTRLFYVSFSGTDSYTYNVEVNSPYVSNSQKAYKSNTISGSNVTIVEDDSCTSAKLVKYVMYGKKSFWTFAAGAKKYEYVFYVPTGTIARDVSLS